MKVGPESFQNMSMVSIISALWHSMHLVISAILFHLLSQNFC